jgi:hypothetical protein
MLKRPIRDPSPRYKPLDRRIDATAEAKAKSGRLKDMPLMTPGLEMIRMYTTFRDKP